MESINKFLEAMDHEFPLHQEISILKEGFKIDGKAGIKVFCKLHELKSVDYFHECNIDGLLYVEFSDLFRQSNQLKEQETEIKGSNLDKSYKKQLLKDLHKKINSELLSKFKDSLHIMRKAKISLKDIPASFNSDIGQYVIIVAPLTAHNKHEMCRLMDQWKSNITSALPNELFTRVKFIPLEKFC